MQDFFEAHAITLLLKGLGDGGLSNVWLASEYIVGVLTSADHAVVLQKTIMRCHLEARQQGLHIRMQELSPIDGGNLNTKAVASLSNQHVRERAMAGLPRLREITWQQLVDVNEAFQKACPYAHYSSNSIILLGFVCTECGSFPKLDPNML